ncbi:hypothetical protein L2E82_22628 [Cichorium intybus]|uniref:Uncharacterized protein n=1 Tax=Cichorium intybus TaxID=13427 RepID=A0ACB9DYQ7_CICIN|nr:hypothetical protein L2E82_22628 [Cichorium intybus]
MPMISSQSIILTNLCIFQFAIYVCDRCLDSFFLCSGRDRTPAFSLCQQESVLLLEVTPKIMIKEGRKKETGLDLTNTKDGNFGEWYSEVVTNGEMIEYYEIYGCYIFRPWTMSIWEIMQVAWVTRSGDSDLEVPFVIRPTSEIVMYPYFTKWIRGHRDLPLKLNQWCNVVRWEFGNPTPFIKIREFLWQEGHTDFATKEEADIEVFEILEVYGRMYEEYLAVPVVKGKKSEMENFAGRLYTTSVEAFVPNTCRGVQAATSHCLGQHFAKMIEVNFEDKKGEKAMVWQNSWAYSITTVTFAFNHFGKGLIQRMPRCRHGYFHVVNNDFTEWKMYAIGGSANPTINSQGNRYIAPPDPNAKEVTLHSMM